MKKHLLLFLFYAIATTANGQQNPQYSQYHVNNFLINPAIAGIENYADVKLSSRSSLFGAEGRPSSYYFSIQSPLGVVPYAKQTPYSKSTPLTRDDGKFKNQQPKHRHGLGFLAVHDEIGAFSRTEANFAYSYHLSISPHVRLASGISTGLIQTSLKSDKLQFADPSDPVNTNWNTLKPNLTMGLWLYGNNFYLGTSATQILSNSINFDNSIVEHNILYKHYFFTAAYKFNVTQQISVVPSIMAMWLKPSPGALDFSMRAIYENRFWVGGSYRQNKKFAILTGVTINHIFDAGYAYDRGVSSFNGIDRGNHEVMIGIRIFNRAKILCPQNLW